MQGAPCRLWTCDRCAHTENVMAESYPEGWSRLIRRDLNEINETLFSATEIFQTTAGPDICQGCTIAFVDWLNALKAEG